jgi:hypothetical protein
MDSFGYDDVLTYLILARESMMLYLDRETRRRRRLLKALTILDLQGFSIFHSIDRRFVSVLGESSKLSETMYPQLLGRSICVNVPVIFHYAFRWIRPLLSPKAVEKILFCSGLNSGKTVQQCPFVSKYLNIADVPSFLGGVCQCPQGCIGGVPNSQKIPMKIVGGMDRNHQLVSMTVRAREKQMVEIPVAKGMTISYILKAEGKKIEVGAMIKLQGLNMNMRETTRHGMKEEEDGMVIVLMEKRYVEWVDGEITGTWIAPVEGLFVMTFDNNDAVFYARKIQYSLDCKLHGSLADAMCIVPT